MNWTAASRSVLPGLCLLVAAGCQDHPTPTEPARTHVGRAAQAVGLSQRPGSTPYLCYTSVATPEGAHRYRYGRMYLHFPGHPQPMARGGTAGATVRYQFRYISVDGTVKRAANCVIPATEAALRMMNRRFATHESNGVDQLPTGDGSAVIQTVALEQIVVEASGCSNPDWQRDDSGVCWPPTHDPGGADGGDPWGGGGDDPWGGSGGGGIGGDDPEPPEPDEPCNTGDPVLDSAHIQDLFKVMWEESNYSPTTPQDQRLEHYTWLIDRGDGSYTMAPMEGMEPSPCGSLEGAYVVRPANAVAFVHTHPWRIGEIQTSCGSSDPYMGLPSQDDVNTSIQLGIPGYILDADQITRFDGTLGATPVGSLDRQVTRCGY